MTATPSVDREALRRKSAPLLLCERARALPDAVAFRCKHLGLYRERNWRDYAALVARTARAFAELGLARGERVAIMGDACEQWLICDLAAQSLGAIVYGIYPTASAAEVEYQLRDGGAVMFIAENQEYVDKILSFADGLSALKWIVVLDDSAMFATRIPCFEASDVLLAPVEQPDLYGWRSRRDGSSEEPAFIVYTSGTNGHPRGRWSPTAHLAATATWSSIIRRSRKSPPRWSTCRSGLRRSRRRDAADLAPRPASVRAEDLPRHCSNRAHGVVHCSAPPVVCPQILLGILNSSSSKRATADLAAVCARPCTPVRDGEAGLAREARYCACRAGVFVPILQARLRPAGARGLRRRATSRPRPWRCGRCSASTWWRCTARLKPRAHHQRPAYSVSAARNAAGSHAGGRSPKESGGADLFDCYWNNRTQPAPSRARTPCAPAISANGRARCLVDRARLHCDLGRQDDLAVVH
jgi:hypothetical protein